MKASDKERTISELYVHAETIAVAELGGEAIADVPSDARTPAEDCRTVLADSAAKIDMAPRLRPRRPQRNRSCVGLVMCYLTIRENSPH